MPPLVSVVLSAYNRPEFLAVSLSSVLRQSLADIEVIVQDDSTDDRCQELVRQCSDARVRYTHNRPPLGTGANLRDGYRKCRGKYIATLNDDDFYAAGYLETMATILEANPAVSLAFADHYIAGPAGEVLLEKSDRCSETWGRSTMKEGLAPDPLRTALVDKSVPAMFAVCRAQAVDLNDFPEEVGPAYDEWLSYLAVRDGGSVWYHPHRLTYYRVHAENQSAHLTGSPRMRLRGIECEKFILRRLLGDRRVSSIWPELRRRLASMCATVGFAHLRLGQRRQAREQFATSMKADLTLRAVAGFGLSLSPGFVFQRLERSFK